jgi:hypothetical protein
MKSQFQLLTFNLVPETKFIDIDPFNSMWNSGLDGVKSYFLKLYYRSSATLLERQSSIDQSWNQMISQVLNPTDSSSKNLKFIDKNKILIAQSMLIIELIKFSGLISLCIGDSMVDSQLT